MIENLDPVAYSIPHTVHMVWLQGEEAMPSAAKFNLNTWSKFNPGMQSKVHDESSIVKLLQQWPRLLQRFHEAPNRPSKKDIAQFAILYQYGGLFVDVDVQCLRSIVGLLDANTLLPVEYINDNGLGTKKIIAAMNIVGAAPGHPIIKSTMDGMAATVYKPALHTRLRYIAANVANWSKAVTAGFSMYACTPLQFFIQPAHLFGLDNVSKYMASPILKGHPDAYTVFTGTFGSWHNVIQMSYHRCVDFAHRNSNGVKFTFGVLWFLFVVFVIVSLSILLARKSPN
jgi:hypothetical protein